MDVPVGEGQQGRVERVVAVTEDGVPLVDLLHHLRVQTVLLDTQPRGEESAWSPDLRNVLPPGL